MNLNIAGISATQIAQMALQSTQEEFMGIVEDLSSGKFSGMSPSDTYVSEDINIDTASRYAAVENAQQGINVTQVADGTYSDVTAMLGRIMELSTQASSDIYSDAQRQAMQAEVNQLTEQISKSLAGTTYNGKNLINVVSDGEKNAENIDFQVGTNSLPSSTISYDPNIKLGEMNFDLSSAENARASMKQAEEMINTVSAKRSEIAATQTGLINSVEANMTAIVNNQASYSTIADTDYAASMLGLVQNQIKQESLVAVLSSTLKSQGNLMNLIYGISA